MTAGLLRPPAWTTLGACIGHPLGPAAWDTNEPAARRVCAGCPVRLQCALEALDQAIPGGTWGGLTPDDRREVAAHHGYDRPGLPQHGNRSRYVHRDHPCRCPLCTEAHRRYIAEQRGTPERRARYHPVGIERYASVRRRSKISKAESDVRADDRIGADTADRRISA